MDQRCQEQVEPEGEPQRRGRGGSPFEAAR